MQRPHKIGQNEDPFLSIGIPSILNHNSTTDN